VRRRNPGAERRTILPRPPGRDNSDIVRTPAALLVVGSVFMLVMAALAAAAIVFYPATQRMEGMILILFAVVSDSFLGGFIWIFGLLARKLWHRPDIMADLYHKRHRFAGNLVSWLFLLPMLIAVVRILNLETY